MSAVPANPGPEKTTEIPKNPRESGQEPPGALKIQVMSERDAKDTTPQRSSLQSQLAKLVYPYSHSPWPVWSLSALFVGTSMAGFNPALPPMFHRLGFSAIFGGAGYIISTGDIKNGTGTTTAWSAIYLLSTMFQKVGKNDPPSRSRRYPRHPLGLVLTAATFVSTAVYGGEYFLFENFDEEPK